MFNAKNKSTALDDTYIDYVSFGKGKKALVILPGLSTRGIKGTASVLAGMFRIFVNDYKVYVIDRKNKIPEGYSVDDMADDTAAAMKNLGIERASIFGASQGGMIAQVLAEKYPHMVEKLVLGATASRQNDALRAAAGKWIELARQGDYISLNRDSFAMLYTEEYLKKNRLLLPAAERMKPDDLGKFVILAEACLGFDGYDELDKIKCPVLVIGGRKDKVLTAEASEEIAKKLGCELYIYEEYGHAVYDEAPDFRQRVFDFLQK